MTCRKSLLITKFKVPKTKVKKDETAQYAIDVQMPDFFPQYSLNAKTDQKKS